MTTGLRFLCLLHLFSWRSMNQWSNTTETCIPQKLRKKKRTLLYKIYNYLLWTKMGSTYQQKNYNNTMAPWLQNRQLLASTLTQLRWIAASVVVMWSCSSTSWNRWIVTVEHMGLVYLIFRSTEHEWAFIKYHHQN